MNYDIGQGLIIQVREDNSRRIKGYGFITKWMQ